MVTTPTKLGVSLILWAVIASAVLAQKAAPGPTVPGPTTPEKSLPVPKGGDNIVINPTGPECKAGWRPGMRWTQQEFDAFCKQFEISK